MLHRLPGALCWSQTALRLLFTFLENTEGTLAAADKKEGKGRALPKAQSAAGAASPHDVATRTASAVGVAMTHWVLFLLNLRSELLAVHHAARLFHAWCWGTSAPAAPGTKLLRTTPRRTQKEAPEKAVADLPLADVAASLTSKGKLLLLYLQWCFPAFRCAVDGGDVGVASGAAGSTASSAGVPATAAVNVPTFFTGELENDAASTVAVRRSPAECAALLADVVAHTAQLLRRVTLLLSYCHAIRARSLTALESSQDAAMARLVAFMGPSASTEVDARVPTEQEKAFLKGDAKPGG